MALMSLLSRQHGYSLYVLLLLLLAYFLNQLDRYMLAITAAPMAHDVHFGDKGCLQNKTFADESNVKCNGTTEQTCDSISDTNGSYVCMWDYTGQGLEYQIVAGPVFILVYTFFGIFIGIAADLYNRKVILGISLLVWSTMTLLTGFITAYWQLVVLRFGLGLGEAGCTPFATSLLADYFVPAVRGTALGVYNWGIYMGYSLSYAVGNFITIANINGQGWRWAFFLSGIPGLILGVVILLTLKEPDRSRPLNNVQDEDRVSLRQKFVLVLKTFVSPSLLLLCVAGSVRNAAGYVWAYNTQNFFLTAGQTKSEIGSYMSWIPLVGGSLGVVLGGFIADRIVKKRGLYTRVIVLFTSQLLAAPFAAGTLYFDAPWSYICQIPTYIFGEMWVGVTFAVALELVPPSLKTATVAFYLFIISNVGGNAPLLVPLTRQLLENAGYSRLAAFRGALYIFYPGLYIIGGFLFLLTMFVLRWDLRRVKRKEGYIQIEDECTKIEDE